MPQPWYGPPSVNSGHLSQAGAAMHHQRYHHGAPGPAGMIAPVYSAHRSSPTGNRPPSSMSTSSATSSYTVASGPVSLSQGPNGSGMHHLMPIEGRPSPGHQGHPGYGHHGGMHPSARYPIPPRTGGGHNMVHGSHMPIRSYHGAQPAPMSQSLRHFSGENSFYMGGSASPQYGPVEPPGSMGQQVDNTPLHHPVPYRHHLRMHHEMAGPPSGPSHHFQYHHQGYNHGGARRSSYPPVTPHHHPMGGSQQYYTYNEPKYTHYQRPMYESPLTVDNSSLRGSPSPPPPPPVAQGRDNEVSTPSYLAPPSQSMSADTSVLKPVLLSSKNVTEEPPANNWLAKEKPAGTEDDDAASILLQLSGVPSQSETEAEQTANENRPMSTVHGAKSELCTSQSTGDLVKNIESSLSIDDDTTIATAEGGECSAPDLTSEPSSDSIDHNDSEFPAWFPENYPTRLARNYDDTKLNSLHCFLRSELLEIFVVEKSSHKSPTHSPGSSVGRVGLRCVHCALVRKQKENKDEAPMAVFYPKSIAEIYRLVTSWQRCHLRKCRNLPPGVRAEWMSLRESDKSRGKTHYWITSAKELGLIDCQSRAGGIRFGPNTKGNDEAAVPKEKGSVCTSAHTLAKPEASMEPSPEPITDAITKADDVTVTHSSGLGESTVAAV